MEKSLRLFLSLSLLGASRAGYCQSGAATTPACGSQQAQDSLITKYLINGAHRYGYLHPNWARYCDSLIAICPTIAYAYQQKAIPLIKDGQYEAAFALENKAAELDPNQYLAYRGFLKCIFTKDYAGAVSDFQQVARLKPNGREMDHTYPFFEGLCHLELGDYPQAEADFAQDMRLQREADSQSEVHYNTLFYVGVLYVVMKNDKLAHAYLARCLQAYPQHPEANYYLALLHRKQGNHELAKRHLNLAQQALTKGYTLNEDNTYYANYPRQITAYEVGQALR